MFCGFDSDFFGGLFGVCIAHLDQTAIFFAVTPEKALASHYVKYKVAAILKKDKDNWHAYFKLNWCFKETILERRRF